MCNAVWGQSSNRLHHNILQFLARGSNVIFKPNFFKSNVIPRSDLLQGTVAPASGKKYDEGCECRGQTTALPILHHHYTLFVLSFATEAVKVFEQRFHLIQKI